MADDGEVPNATNVLAERLRSFLVTLRGGIEGSLDPEAGTILLSR